MFTPFENKISAPLSKQKITILQVNLGRKCNLACHHCHVEASPIRTEELSSEVCGQIIELIRRFPQIETVDLTGGAPEMNYGFKPIVEAARLAGKEVIVRSNLTIFFQPGYEDLPDYFARHRLRVVASLPCYLEDNVDKQRGKGVYSASILAMQKLNQLGYGVNPELVLDLVYNPQVPKTTKFSLAPDQFALQEDYKMFLQEHFDIVFNHLFTLNNLPIGRTKTKLKDRSLYEPYIEFLEAHYNPQTLPYLMCKNQLSIDYLGNVYDCDFNQMEYLQASTARGELLTLDKILESNSLDLITEIKIADFCYGCTAGSGSSCGGSLV